MMQDTTSKRFAKAALVALSPLLTSAFVPNFAVQPTKSRNLSLVTSAASSNNDQEISDGKKYLEEVNTRRSFFQSTAFAVMGLSVIPPQMDLLDSFTLAHADDPALDYKAVSKDIAETIQKNPDWGPTYVRLAWHSSGTYDKVSKSGGSYGGTSHFKTELDHGANAGLAVTAVEWLEPIRKKYPGISYGDLYTLAGVTAIKEMGGPTIPWSSGRVDVLDEADSTPDGRLPAADSGPPGADKADSDHLRTIFGRMGFNDKEIVALSGAHALGRCHTTASGYDGPWTPTPTTFNNAYFTLLKGLPWTEKKWDGPFQYEGAGGTLMMLPTDFVLLKDKKFKKYVDLYAKDGKKFEDDFSAAFSKLITLGTKDLTPVDWA